MRPLPLMVRLLSRPMWTPAPIRARPMSLPPGLPMHRVAPLPNGTVRHWRACPQAPSSYPYVWASHFKTETIGFSGQTGARATITLPPSDRNGAGVPETLVLEAINGTTWKAALAETP